MVPGFSVFVVSLALFFGTSNSASTTNLGDALEVGADAGSCAFASTVVQTTCALPNGNAVFCESHCRCVHGGTWGQCVKRPAGVGSPADAGKPMCQCYYDTPKPASGYNPEDLLFCNTELMLAQKAKFCTLPNFPLPAADLCNKDCVCAHGFAKGECDALSYCRCSNSTATAAP